MQAERTAGQLRYDQTVTIKALPRPKEEPARPTKSENRVCGDNLVSPLERQMYKTPLAMIDTWAREQEIFGTHGPAITIEKSYRKWEGTAHLEIESPALLSNDGLTLHFSVTGNPDYMAQPQDLIPIYLETPTAEPNKPGERQLMVVVIEPTWDYNHWEIRVEYTLDQLATILKLNPGGAVTANTITQRYRELGLRAQWLGVADQQEVQINGVRHESGGLDQKGGSGKLRLVPYTLLELAGTETRRNTSWNMSEKLNTSRPVFVTFGEILQGGKEMMTTLECEAEYKLPREEDLDQVIMAMKKLHGDGELQKALGILKMTGEQKEYEDTYFDLPDSCDLLTNQIVLRRRHRAKDAEGTFLFALKGATYHNDKDRRLRLAAQCQLKTTALTTTAGQVLLRRFLTDDSADNAVGRTMCHALKNARPVLVRLAQEDVVPTLTIVSKRETFTMTLANGTQIDFSADKATGRLGDGRSAAVYSFEFGVGHPALTQAATSGGPTTGGDGDAPKKTSVKDRINQFVGAAPQIVRPYHVPADLENPAVFDQPDYQQFVHLLNAVVGKVFQLDIQRLELGGNKAHDLAKLLKLI
ncbi:hypothetical protein Cme02nite_49040 [Catellatospora methionotrophica]|uniref:Uncharacterized protein n=1 Tax=Catellatospora methionotrophica TaxID=121620 RepID=A0A8J3L8X4_9ACTN|nr:hypothetical protein [Catellatospora methionotrophica]GIG16572.1 hypothetical protein Cme02nite_49040 [Catellatospora methionotrophica]